MRPALVSILFATAAAIASPAAAAPASADCEMPARVNATGCAVLEGMIADARRDATFAAMSKDWPADRRAAFERLRAAEETFAWAVAEHETDRASPRAAADAVAAEQAEKRVFARMVVALAKGEHRAVATSSLDEADGALNATYGNVMAVSHPVDLGWGSIGKAGIRRTQRAWLAYRDAFAAFAATFDPASVPVLEAEITRRRTASLETFLAD